MKLEPRPPRKTPTHQVREEPAIVAAFNAQALAAGTSISEALLQLIRHYNAHPRRLKPRPRCGAKTACWGVYFPRSEDERAWAHFQLQAAGRGLRGAEALRRCVRDFLERQS